MARQAMTSEWSPKMDSAWPANARAATCITYRSLSNKDLEAFFLEFLLHREEMDLETDMGVAFEKLRASKAKGVRFAHSHRN